MSVTSTKILESEIINQKKSLIFKVEQTVDHAFPNEDFKYYIYLKNISGVNIDNIKIKVNNPSEILFNTHYEDEGYIEIGTLKPEEVKFIYLKANCQATGKHYVHFICHGDGTGLYYKSLKLICSYTHSSDEIIHRLHIYDFQDYEDTYFNKVDNFSPTVTQLFKTQKLPFRAGEQPFSMVARDEEISAKPFSNIEQESFLEQNNLLKNTKEHVYHYLTRENFNENSAESYEGKNIFDLIEQVNKHSKLFRAKFLKTGTNELNTDFYQYSPNGFIHRFGLLNSEIYHYLGTLPTYSYMSDVLFRWAPDGKEPLNLYPQKIAMKWDRKVWSGQGYIVYRILTEDYLNWLSHNTDNTFSLERWLNNKEERWKAIGFFNDLKSAEAYKERQLYVDSIDRERLQRGFNKYQYYIKQSYYDTGVFFVHIPINKIPSNFYLLDTTNIEALIQRAKPFGAKALIRYMVEEDFDNHMEFQHYPIFKPYTEIDLDLADDISYFIQSKKFQLIEEQKCNQTLEHYGLKPYGLTSIYNIPLEEEPYIDETDMIPTIYMADKTQELIEKNVSYCNGNQKCEDYMKNDRPYPDNTLEHKMKCDTLLQSSYVDNDLRRIKGVSEVLYMNNFDKISFRIPKIGFKPYRTNNRDNDLSNNSFIHQWMNSSNYKAYSYQVERIIQPGSDYYIFKNQQKKVNGIEVLATNREIMNEEGGELGIGFVDIKGKNHMFSVKYDKNYGEDYIQYSTMYNNNFKLKKDGFTESAGLVIKTQQIPNDYTNTLVIFFIEYENKLEYFHHIICPNLSEYFIFVSENLSYKIEPAYDEATKRPLYTDDKGNDIYETRTDDLGQEYQYPVSTYVNDEGKRRPGERKYDKIPIEIGNLIYYNYSTNEEVTYNTPQYNDIDKYETTNVFGGENWTNLYRINKAENSYTYINNSDNEAKEVDNIYLHFDNIEIPEKSKIKNIRLKTIVDSSHTKEMYVSSSYQNNYILKDAEGKKLKLQSNNMECYHQSNESQYHYYAQLEKTNNKRKIEEFTKLLNDDIIFNESVDFDEGIKLNNPYWMETTEFTRIPYDCNNIKNIELVIEGYNSGADVNIISQLLYEDLQATPVKHKITSGYFFTKINLPFTNDFLLDWTRLRFRFEELNSEIEIFDYYLNVTFINKESQEMEFTETDEVINRNKNIQYLDLLQEETTAEELNNGLTVELAFNDLNPGEYYRIYSNELEIEYTVQDVEMMINKNRFFSDYEENFLSISGETEDAYLSGEYFLDVNHYSQRHSEVGPDNLGLELKDTLYQAFVLPTDNITGIQIYQNGFLGSPDASLKLGIYENRGTTPGKLIKEVGCAGWSKSNKNLKDQINIKYEIEVEDLKPYETYWFGLSVENPRDNSFYLLNYTTKQIEGCKLLLKEDNNFVNAGGSLKFDIYSKDLSYGFSDLPTMQDYLPNPFVKIGLHHGQGTIKKLTLKKKNDLIERFIEI